MRLFANAILFLLIGCSGAKPSLAAPLGYTLPKYLERANAPTPEWAKAHPKFTTAQTPNIDHSCKKDLHGKRCIKRCVKLSTRPKRSVKGSVIKQITK